MPPRVLVLAQRRSRGSLAGVRALGEAGWTVGLGTPGDPGMVGSSRHVTATHVVPRPRGGEQDFVTAVAAAVDAGGYDVVFGGADDWMAALAHHRHEVGAAVAHPCGNVVDRLLDKRALADLAVEHGLAAPRTVGSLDAVDWDGPLVVKCRRHWFPGVTAEQRIEARRHDGVAAARAHVAELEAVGHEPVVQQLVGGRLLALIGLFDGARLQGRVQQEADGLWPTPAGVSARATTVPVDEQLAQRLDALLAAVGWRGLVEAQFLVDEAGVPHLIDCNGRFFGSMALALAAGPNIVDAWGRCVLGEELPALPDGRPGVRYVWTAGDLRRAWAERRGGLVADLSGTARLVGGGAVTSVLDRDDPGPFLHVVGAWAGRQLSPSRG